MPEDTDCLTFRICYEGDRQPEVLSCGVGARFDRADGKRNLNLTILFIQRKSYCNRMKN